MYPAGRAIIFGSVWEGVGVGGRVAYSWREIQDPVFRGEEPGQAHMSL